MRGKNSDQPKLYLWHWNQNPQQNGMSFLVRISLLKWKWTKLIMSELLFQKLFINNYGISIDTDKPKSFMVIDVSTQEENLGKEKICSHWFSSVQFNCSVMSDSLRLHGLQHARPPCLSPAPGVYSNSCLLSQWCHPTISSSVVPFSLQSFPASGSFQMSELFASGGQSIRVSASASVLPVNTKDWSPLGWTGWISLQSKGLSRVFSNTTVQKHQFFSAQLSLKSNSHIHTWLLAKL